MLCLVMVMVTMMLVVVVDDVDVDVVVVVVDVVVDVGVVQVEARSYDTLFLSFHRSTSSPPSSTSKHCVGDPTLVSSAS
jgi:hypothetical protein